ncbi:hypothetical protein F5Y02DRAFT_101266 [Annulohypoxylon stygium]|nr:hypothetical protein F5Y02DRAFT_101266 [Annulohypoxylon stygium]
MSLQTGSRTVFRRHSHKFYNPFSFSFSGRGYEDINIWRHCLPFRVSSVTCVRVMHLTYIHVQVAPEGMAAARTNGISICKHLVASLWLAYLAFLSNSIGAFICPVLWYHIFRAGIAHLGPVQHLFVSAYVNRQAGNNTRCARVLPRCVSILDCGRCDAARRTRRKVERKGIFESFLTRSVPRSFFVCFFLTDSPRMLEPVPEHPALSTDTRTCCHRCMGTCPGIYAMPRNIKVRYTKYMII